MALADSGPSLFTLGIMFAGDMNLTNSLSSVKLECSLYGTSYLMMVPCCHLLPGDFFFPLPNDQPVGEKATIRLNLSAYWLDICFNLLKLASVHIGTT